MAHLLRVPEIAAGTTEAVLATWPIAENSPYSATDVIATVETAKAVIDIEAEENGVILRRLVSEGADVAVGQPIALIGAPGESAENIEEELRAQGIMPDALVAADAVQASAAASGGSERIFISPIARRLARAAGLDLRDISGTGPNGRIMRRDVEQAVRAAADDVAQVQPETPAAVTAPELAMYTEVPHSRVRRTIASRLTESKQTVPHFYISGSARAAKLLRLRAELNDGASPVRISLNDLVIKAVAHAHQLVLEAAHDDLDPGRGPVICFGGHRDRDCQPSRTGDTSPAFGGKQRDHGSCRGRQRPG